MRLSPRPFGRTGLPVTPLVLAHGAIRGSASRGPALKPEDVERAFHEQGVTTFLVYWAWPAMVEGLRRLVRAGHRHELVLLTETGLPGGTFVRRSFEKTARAVGVDHVDVCILGWLRSRGGLGLGSWKALEKLKDEGKTRAIGFSSHDRLLATAVAREIRPDVLMLRYNAAHRGIERQVFDALGNDRPAILAYTATRWGFLLKPLPARGFPEAMRAGECYRFVLSHPAVDAVLCAARSPEELREDVEAVLAGPLDPGRLEACRRFGDEVHAAARGGWRWMFREAPGPPSA